MGIKRVMPWGTGQGEFVEIDEENFDPDFHKPYVEGAAVEDDEGEGEGDDLEDVQPEKPVHAARRK